MPFLKRFGVSLSTPKNLNKIFSNKILTRKELASLNRLMIRQDWKQRSIGGKVLSIVYGPFIEQLRTQLIGRGLGEKEINKRAKKYLSTKLNK